MDSYSPNKPNDFSRAKGYLGLSFTLALIAHGILFVFLLVSMQWRAEPSGPVYAELWTSNGEQTTETSQEAVEEPEPEPEPQPEPEPEPEPEPQPEPEPPEPPEPETPPTPVLPPIAQTDLDRQANLLEDPDIVQERLDREVRKQQEEKQRILEEQRKLEEAKRAEERRKAEEARKAEELRRQEEERARQEELKRQKEEEERRLAEEKRKREEIARAEAEAKAAAVRREAMLNRLTGQASSAAAGGGRNAMTSFQQARYNNQIIACIRPHITFNTPSSAKRNQYVASFEVRLLRNGSQAAAPKLLKSSGLRSFDTAVEKAILLCNPFPKPPVGDVPSAITLNFDPVEDAQH